MKRNLKHLYKKQEHNILQKVAPKYPKWKLIKFQKYLIKGVQKFTTLKKFRKINNSNIHFENEVADITKVLLTSKMEEVHREQFYIDLGKNEAHHMVICKDQLILFYIHKDDETKIVDSIRYDATENNIEMCVLLGKGKQVKEFIEEGRKIDRFKDNNTELSLEKILSIADAILID